MTDYQRGDGLVARTDLSTPCRCGRPDCEWTEGDDRQRDLIEWADKNGPILYPEMYPELRVERTPEMIRNAWATRP